jgi:endo-1,4-beta-D-glucanase Y
MNWQIAADGSVIGFNAATDADEDMAIALIVADKKWGGDTYGNAARNLIQNILEHEVEAQTNVLKPGDVWGGSDLTNPSYFAPAYYKVFATYTGNERWNKVADKCYEVLAAINEHNENTGLVPDWVTAHGTPSKNRSYDYGYDACRMPWRLAHDFLWYRDVRAKGQLEQLNKFWASVVGSNNIHDGYTLTGKQVGSNENASFITMAAAGAVVSGDADFCSTMWQAGMCAWNQNYYSHSLHVLGLLTASGKMVNPLTLENTAAQRGDLWRRPQEQMPGHRELSELGDQ